jgi:hypothetical protein
VLLAWVTRSVAVMITSNTVPGGTVPDIVPEIRPLVERCRVAMDRPEGRPAADQASARTPDRVSRPVISRLTLEPAATAWAPGRAA